MVRWYHAILDRSIRKGAVSNPHGISERLIANTVSRTLNSNTGRTFCRWCEELVWTKVLMKNERIDTVVPADSNSSPRLPPRGEPQINSEIVPLITNKPVVIKCGLDQLVDAQHTAHPLVREIAN